MLKRGIPIVLISVLSIAVIILFFNYRKNIEDSNWQQTNVNIEIRTDLNLASASFCGNSLTIENGKDFNYNRAMTMINSASQLFQFSTYNKNNNNLLIILENLSNLMENNEYKAAVIQKSTSIYESLSQLSINPEDKKATDNLSKLVTEIRQNK